MNAIYLLLLVTLMKIDLSHGFAPRIKVSHPSSSSKSANSVRHKTSLNSIEAFSALVAMGDYAAEIEKGVGEEIYAPIFKSGILSYSYPFLIHLYLYVCAYILIYVHICIYT
jgi:hypothetical protein